MEYQIMCRKSLEMVRNVKNMRAINIEERKSIQIDILKKIHEFCSHSDIKYSLGYGTLLGAIRHGGYIPWDDDIDIVMLRKDYDKFIADFRDQRYKIASVETHNEWFLPFAKVYDNNTLIVDRKANTPAIGINVDVFPIDNAPNDSKAFMCHRKKISILVKCNGIKLFKINRYSTWHNNAIGMFLKLLLVCFPKYYFVHKIVKMSREFENKECEKAVYWASIGTLTVLNKSIYETITTRNFEGICFSSLEDYDTYLTNIYGNYMEIPPIEKRISYHTSDAYWKNE